MKWIRKVFLKHFDFWLSLQPPNSVRLEAFSFCKIVTVKIWEIQEYLFPNSFSKPIVTTIKKLFPKITKRGKTGSISYFASIIEDS